MASKQMSYTAFVKHLALSELYAERVSPTQTVRHLEQFVQEADSLETIKKRLWYKNFPTDGVGDAAYRVNGTNHTYDVVDIDLMHGIIGMCSESGEVAAHLQNALENQTPIDRDQLLLELGDVIWYWTLACTGAGFTPEEVIQANANKLMARYAHKFAPKADEVVE